MVARKIRLRHRFRVIDARDALVHSELHRTASLPSRASLITHVDGWILAKRKGEKERSERIRERVKERERERVEGRRYKRHECESLLALLFVQEAHRELCAGLYLRAPCTLRLSNFFFVFFFALRKIINDLFFRPLITLVIFYRINENLGLYLRSFVYLTL